MMIQKQMIEKTSSLKVKTGLKAGAHCRIAFNDVLNDSRNQKKIDHFVNCCRGDNKCLH